MMRSPSVASDGSSQDMSRGSFTRDAPERRPDAHPDSAEIAFA
jgi:hypothetical protein